MDSKPLQRLHGKGQRVNDGTHNQAGEIKGHQTQSERLRELADGAVRPHCDQNVKAQYGRREHQR